MSELADKSRQRWAGLQHARGRAEDLPGFLDDLANATDRTDAATAAWALIDRVSSEAVTEATARVIIEIREIVQRNDFPWLAEALSVLDSIANNIGTWAKLQHEDAGPRHFDVMIGWEHDCASALEPITPMSRSWITHSDPEVRSIAVGFLAEVSSKPSGDHELIARRHAEEPHDLARACMAAAMVKLMIRDAGGEVTPAICDLIQRLLISPDKLVRARMAWTIMIDEIAGFGDQPSRILREAQDSTWGHLWAAEI